VTEKPYRELVSSEDREAWLAARTAGIGASEAAAVLDLNPWDSPFALYARKRGEAPAIEDNENMKWGRRLEGTVASAFAEETGRTVWGGGVLLQSIEYPWLLATPDREQRDPSWDDDGLLEVKTTGLFDEWREDVPVYYQVQLQQQLLVKGKKKGSIACLIGGQRFVWADFDRHDGMCELLIEKGRVFWDRVQNGDPPDIDPSKATIEALRKMAETSNVVELPGVVAEWHHQRQALAAAEKEARASKEELDRLIAAAIGTASTGIMPDGVGAYIYKTRSRREHTVAAASWRELRFSAKGLK